MNISAPFIRRPIATALLTLAVALAGASAFFFLPVSPLPQVDFPTISVAASLPGASPETMASAVATPLERQFTRIAGVTEMTSSSYLGTTSVTLQFDLSRNINAAARDVQAAINAARGNLPANLPSNPSYRKVNPADSPIMIITLTSKTLSKGQMYDVASTVLQQKLSQLDGVGQVSVGGSSLPAVRVELNPNSLNSYGIALEAVRTVLANANANLAKGQLSGEHQNIDLAADDQLFQADQYKPLIVNYLQGAPVRIADLGQVVDSVEDVRNAGFANGVPSVLLIIFRQPGANIIDTVDRIRSVIPQLQADIPQAIRLSVALDQTVTIRASVQDVERTLIISVVLVVLVVFLFLRNLRVMLIPGIVVPVSLIGTFGVMYLLGYSIDNLSLMAMTIATGFVVDDAIVVVENITRYLEEGLSPLDASLKGAAEIGFTVLSISLSLVAVFIPILLMGGIVGRLFSEFAVTLSVAIIVSMIISLTTTPMMCAHLLRSEKDQKHGRLYRWSETFFEGLVSRYDRSLSWVLRHAGVTLIVFAGVLALNVYLFKHIPLGFFPQQDTGRLTGSIVSDQATSFQSMQVRLAEMIAIVRADPAVDTVIGFTGGSGTTLNTARLFLSLKPLAERNVTADQIIARLRPKLSKFPGTALLLQAVQDVRVGGRSSNAQYQYTLRTDNILDLNYWAPRVLEEMRKIPILTDVNTDQQNNGQQAYVDYDRETAARFGISAQLLDTTLYDAFGQRQVSTMYTTHNQYHVVMEVAPEYWQNPESLQAIRVPASDGSLVPLSAVVSYAPSTAPMSVNHQGEFPAATISFNLPAGVSLSQAVNEIQKRSAQIGLPASLVGSFQGTAQAFQVALANEPILLAAAVAAVYIILGILYESFIHPLTILSTLPSAGVGALLALMIFKIELSLIAIIGIVLLIGIVKKNAIMMIDFALAAERLENKSPREAIYQACLLRFRPILMTTLAALFGAVPLAFGSGTGSELRRPLGIAIIGGLIMSQILTLYTTPVIYLTLDRLRLRFTRKRVQSTVAPASSEVPSSAQEATYS